MSDTGKRIRAAREAAGMTQEELALKVGYSSKSTINKIEMGINELRQKKVKVFAEALGVSPAYLMGWEDESGKSEKTDIENDKTEWYLNPEAAEIAQRIFEDPKLRILFDSAKDVRPEDLDAIQVMVDALIRKERHEN